MDTFTPDDFKELTPAPQGGGGQAFTPDDFKELQVGAGQAAAIGVGRGLLPAGLGTLGAVGLGILAPEVGVPALLLNLIGGLGGGAVGAVAQNKLEQNLLSPEAQATIAAGQQQHPIASMAGGLAGNLPFMEFDPSSTIKGLGALPALIRGEASPAQRLATQAMAANAGIATGVGVAAPLVQGQTPTKDDVLSSLLQAALFGKPRFGMHEAPGVTQPKKEPLQLKDSPKQLEQGEQYQVTPQGHVVDVNQLAPSEKAEFQREAQAEGDNRPKVNTVAAGLEAGVREQVPTAEYLGAKYRKEGENWITDNPPQSLNRRVIRPGEDAISDSLIRELDKQVAPLKGRTTTKDTIEEVTGVSRKPVEVKDQGNELVFREQWEKHLSKGILDPYPEGGTFKTMTPQQEQGLAKVKDRVDNLPLPELERLRAQFDKASPSNKFQGEVLRMMDEKLGRGQIEPGRPELGQNPREFATSTEKEFDKEKPFGIQAAKDKTLPTEVLRNKISSTISKGEVAALNEAGFEGWLKGKGDRVSGDEVKQWIQENGPKVEVRKFGEGGMKPNQKEYNKVTHEWYDQLGNTFQRDLNSAYDKGLTPDQFHTYIKQRYGDSSIHSNEDINNFLEKGTRYLALRRAAAGEGEVPPSAHWSFVAPKAEKDMPGYTEIAVVKPRKRMSTLKDKQTHGVVPGQVVEFPAQHPSTHSFPDNTLAFARGYMETLPNGKKVWHVVEVQSDWAQRVREDEQNFKEHVRRGKAQETEASRAGYSDYVTKKGNDPLLEHYESLALKASIKHAIKEGADAIAVSDAETAMMSEGHDRAVKSPNDEITQEKGMRQHYDQSLPNILKKLTGKEGESVNFGEHEKAMETTSNRRLDDRTVENVKSPRKDLIFRDPSGTPKTSVTAKLFPLDSLKERVKSGEPASMYRTTYPEKPSEQSLRQQYDSLVKKFKEAKTADEKFNIQGEIEKIKNNNGGLPPKEEGGKEPAKPLTFEEAHKKASPLVQEELTKLGVKDGSSAHDAIKKIAADPQFFGSDEATLAKFLSDNYGKLLDKAKLNAGHDPLFYARTGTKRAAYDLGSNQVHLNVGDRSVIPSLLHEVAHAATSNQYKFPKTETQMRAVRDLDNLMKQVVDALPPEVKKLFEDHYKPSAEAYQGGMTDFDRPGFIKAAEEAGVNSAPYHDLFYGLTNPREFISMIFESKGVRNLLDSLPAEGKGWFQKAVDVVKKLLGIQGDSVLDRAFDNLVAVGQEGETGKYEQTPALKDFYEPGNPIRKLGDDLEKEWEAGKAWWKGRDVKASQIPAMANKAENKGRLMARQVANDVQDRLKRALGHEPKEVERNALTMLVEAQGDISKLNAMATKLAGKTDYWAKDAQRAIGYAQARLNQLQPVAKFYEQVNKAQVNAENAKGIPTMFREGYVAHVQDLSDINSILFEKGSPGLAGGYTKERTHETFADSIAAGIKPRSLDAIDAMEHRMSAGLRRIGRAEMVNGLKFVNDPKSGSPVIVDARTVTRSDGKTYQEVPPGYNKDFIGDQVIGVNNRYSGLIQNITGESGFTKSTVGRAAMNLAHTVKHVTLLGDLFHLVRLTAYAAPLRATLDNPLNFAKSTKPAWLSLDYNEPTLRRMAAAGEIDPALLPGILAKKRDVAIALKTGFNIGRVSDNLYRSITDHIPIVGDYNKWLFEKYQRGIMMETWGIEFDRRKAMEPGLSEEEVGRKVSKDLNIRFGNLLNESFIKNKTTQDWLRLAFLAPQWNEGLIRSELGAVKQGGEAVADAVTKRKLVTGALVRDSGILFASMFMGNQIINYITRGKPTWENEENQPGAKISAFIPDAGGKSEGFFFNPLAVNAEIMHTLIEKAEKDKSVIAAVNETMGNKFSAVGRAVDTFRTRKDAKGNSLSDWGTLKEMASDLTPTPILGKAVKGLTSSEEDYPGSRQKNLMASVGIRTDPIKSSDTEKEAKIAGKPIEEMSVAERVRAKAKLPKRESSEASAERAIAHEFALKEAVNKGLPDDVQKWVKDNKLNVGGYQESPVVMKQRLSLTDKEREREQELVIQEVGSRLKVLKNQEEGKGRPPELLQRRVDVVLKAARMRAKHELEQEINKRARE